MAHEVWTALMPAPSCTRSTARVQSFTAVTDARRAAARASRSKTAPASPMRHTSSLESKRYARAARSQPSASVSCIWASGRARSVERLLALLRRTGPSQLDLRAQLDHVVGRDAEELRRRACVAGEEHEQRPPPAGEVGASRRDEGLVSEEVARAARGGGEAPGRGEAHGVRDVGRLHGPGRAWGAAVSAAA